MTRKRGGAAIDRKNGDESWKGCELWWPCIGLEGGRGESCSPSLLWEGSIKTENTLVVLNKTERERERERLRWRTKL